MLLAVTNATGIVVWVIGNIVGILLVLAAIWWVLRWFQCGMKDFFSWSIKWGQMKKVKKDAEFEADVERWSHQIDERVHKLDEIKRMETYIRMELDALHEVKDLSDRTKG